MEKSGRNGVSKDLWVPKLNLYFAGAQFPRNSWVDHVFHVNEKWFLRWEKWKRKGMVSELTSRKRERKGKESEGVLLTAGRLTQKREAFHPRGAEPVAGAQADQ